MKSQRRTELRWVQPTLKESRRIANIHSQIWFGQSPAWKLEAIQLEEDSKANSLGQEYFDYFCLL